MASSSDNISMAVFCDFENVALGVRDANFEKFDIRPVLERLLLKGSIVVKKSYCDWDRYKTFKAPMHEANFELIEIPHVRQSGKNSADIRLVVDALDLCYTKSHVNTFVIISGDSDFSPLVSKLRENNKQVIGVGVKQSTSDLLVANCDEFIFYDDLVREQRRTAAKRDERKAQPSSSSSRRANANASDDKRKEELETRKVQALDMVVETFDALVSERGDTGKIWASLLKDTLKRRRPDFSETYYGFRTFGNLLEEAQTRGLFEFGRDEKSGTYVYRSAHAPAAGAENGAPEQATDAVVQDMPGAAALDAAAPVEGAADEAGQQDSRRGRGRGGRKQGGRKEQTAIPALLEPVEQPEQPEQPQPEVVAQPAVAVFEPVADEAPQPDSRRGRGRGGRKAGSRGDVPALPEPVEQELAAPQDDALEQPASQPTLVVSEPEAAAVEEAPAPAKERRRAPRKPAAKKVAAEALAAPLVEQIELPAVEAAPLAEPEADSDSDSAYASDDDANGNVAPARSKSARPAHKAPARKGSAKAAPRARRPAKPKAGGDNS